MTLDLEEAIWAVGLAAFEGGVRSPTHNAAEVELRAAIEAEFAKRIAAAPGVDDAIDALGSAEFAAGLARWLEKPQDAATRAALLAAPGNLRAAIATHVEAEVDRRLACAPGVEAALADLLGQVGCAAHHRDAMAGALRTAITAHVEAEVTRRFAVAPEVAVAIDALDRASAHRGKSSVWVERKESHQEVYESARRDSNAAGAALRAAITADRERAVREAQPKPSAPKSGYYMYAVRVAITDGITVTRETDVSGLWSPELESSAVRMLLDLARPITDAERAAPPAARTPRPTSGEARRLVEEYRMAVDTLAAHCEKPYPSKDETFRLGKLAVDARDALLRALGVEA